MEQQKPSVMSFGKHKGRNVRDVPLGYLRWWKSNLIDSLRLCGGEIQRRKALGLTEEVELQLSALPWFTSENLLQRLEACMDEAERATVHALIEMKIQEYSRNSSTSANRPRYVESGDAETVFDEDDGG
jgi:hypothetical protein